VSRRGIRTARAAVVHVADARASLAAVLQATRFWQCINLVERQAGVPRAEFRIVIKPDLGLYDHGSPTGTDPALVEALIMLLHRRGYTRVAIGSARDGSGGWLENREPLVLAELVGYHFVTPDDQPYEVLDFSDDQVPAPFAPGSVLAGSTIGSAWGDANFRISFAKVKTDDEHGFVLGAESLCDVLPLGDKHLHYRHRMRPPDVCVALLTSLPPHFALLDAVRCSHGQLGSRHPRQFQADTLIASDSLLLADWVACSKMGIDPAASPVNAAALAAFGLPSPRRVVGSLAPWQDWVNPSPLLTVSTQGRSRALSASHAFRPWLTTVNTELFPFRDPIDRRINAALMGMRERAESPLTQCVIAAVNAAVERSHRALEAAWILGAKQKLSRVQLPLGFDPDAYGPEEFDAVATYLEDLASRLAAVPVGADGFRRTDLEGAVLFEFSRAIPAPYREFVARVDICRAISFMNDYLGGLRVEVRHDASGRVVHQAERNVYLPQPNYLALSGGQPIDVAKLEVIRYRRSEQGIYWRTIKSENGSATYDDGSVLFRQHGPDTLVTVLGRQEFTLPPFWRAIRISEWPGLYDALVDHAYHVFFSQTMANFEATYEGRDVRIGRPVEAMEADEEAVAGLPAERLMALGRVASDAAERLGIDVPAIVGAFMRPRRGAPGFIDEDGFRHVRPSDGDASGEPGGFVTVAGEILRQLGGALGGVERRFTRELGEAWRRDAASLRRRDG
jgi:uncharacterized protein (DUF362 family)